MKRIALFMATFVLFSLTMIAQNGKSFYDYTVTDIDGHPFNLASLKGKKVLVVNTASKCGNTPQYADLEKLYKEFGGDKFVIIGFPENNFLNQEPGTNQDIKSFCEKNYGVTFPMMSKISVKGDDMAPVYKWLTSKDLNGVMDSEVTWNFQKYMINPDGKLIGTIPPKENPYSDKVINWIKSN